MSRIIRADQETNGGAKLCLFLVVVGVVVVVVVVVEGSCYYIDIIVEHPDLHTFRRTLFYLRKTTLFELHIGKMLLWSR